MSEILFAPGNLDIVYQLLQSILLLTDSIKQCTQIMTLCTHTRARSFCTVHSTLESFALGSEPCSHRNATTRGDLVRAAKCRAVHPCRTQNTTYHT